jgi:hypothetical protein
MLALVLVVLFGFVPEARANSILNGGFEDPAFSDWAVEQAASGSALFEGGSAHTGHSAAWFGAVGTIADTISETFATTPGVTYVLTFWVAHAGAAVSNSFAAFWDGVPVLTLVNAGSFGYTEYTFSEVATDTTTTISFSGRDVLSFFRLDDVNVTETPEPWTVVLTGLGFLSLLTLAHRTRLRPGLIRS